MTDSSGLQHTNLAVEFEGEPGWPAALPPRRALIPAETCAPLSQAARQALPDTLSENTKRVYRSALQGLNERLAGRCVCDEHLSEVLAEMSAEGLSASTLRVGVAAVNKEAELAGLESPCGRSTRTVLRAHARKAPPPQQVTAVDWQAADLASALAAKEHRPGLAGLRDAALIAVMSDCALRVSEASAIDVEDLARREDGSATLLIRRSKTDQEANGAVLYLGKSTMDRIDVWRVAADVRHGPLFRRLTGRGTPTPHRLTPRSIRRAVARAAESVGIEGASGHSLRVGAAVSLVRSGAQTLEVQQVGRWKDQRMPAHYARHEAAARNAVARYRYGQ